MPLPANANPTQLDETLRFAEVQSSRYLSCSNYNLCLDYAASEHWPSFTCTMCQIYQTECPTDPECFLADLRRLEQAINR